MTADFLTLPDRRLAYQRLNGDAAKTGVMFLGGYASDMTGSKASFLADQCAQANIPFLRFDYRGNGQSSGTFKDCTLGDWLEDTYAAFDRLTHGAQIIIGSSMGGWLALLLAQSRPERIKAVIGVAAALDFTEDLIWNILAEDQREQMQREGFILDPTSSPEHPAVITHRLIMEAREHLVLHKLINVSCPLRLLQGMQDKEVPWNYALKILDKTVGTDVRATLIKDGDHRLSRPQDLDMLWRTVIEFAE